MKMPCKKKSNRLGVSQRPRVQSTLLGNERGQTLIQVLVTAAIMGILLMAMVSMQTMLQREFQALTEKMSALDVMRVMTTTVSNQTACGTIIASGNLVNPSQLPFNAATAASISAANPYVIKLKEIPNLNISPGNAPSTLSSTLKLASSAASQSGLQIVFTSPTTASLQINFDQTQLVRPIKNLSFPLVTSVIAGSTTIASCDGGGGGSCPAGQIVTGINPDGSPQCTAGGGAGTCPAEQIMIGINPDGSPQCTTEGSQAGAPCKVTKGWSTVSGVTVIQQDNFPGGGSMATPTSGKCCLASDMTYGPVCVPF